MKAKRTLKTTLRIKTRKSMSQPTQDLSQTMEIKTEAVFDEVTPKYEFILQIEQPNCLPQRMRLDNDPVLIGRSEKCDISLKLSNVSRNHARIHYIDETYIIEDLESTNGTYVNNVRIKKCALHDHDQIKIGGAKILFLKRPVKVIS